MNGLLDQLLNAPTWWVLRLAGGLVFVEDALFVGFVVPGETAAILAGVAARLGHAPLSAVIVTVVLAAVAGDSVGYEVGRIFGPRIVSWPVLDRHRNRLTRAQDLLARRGGTAVFLGRWTAFFRAVMPALAGSARMPYPRFLAYNAAGGITWGVVVVVGGYLAGASYKTVERQLGHGTALLVAAVALGAVTVWRLRSRRAERLREPATHQ